jgi:hypothetical protein
MKRHAVLGMFSILGFLLLAGADEETLQGFTPTTSAAERQWETKFRAIPSADNQREYMRHLSARPHHVGSSFDKENAEWILSKFKEWGWDAQIETFEVLFPTPKERILEITMEILPIVGNPGLCGPRVSRYRALRICRPERLHGL